MRTDTAKRIVQLSVLIAGCIGCALLSLPAAGILIAAGGAVLLIDVISDRRRRARILGMCDEIDRILAGSEVIRLDDFSEGELGTLCAQIRKMTIRLREQNAALIRDRQFMKEALEDMSHQLRTPLTTSMLLLGLLRKPELSREERQAHITELFSMLTRMQWMLETLLGLSRLEAGAMHFSPEVLPAADLIREALAPLEISMELKALTLHTRIEGDPVLTADRSLCIEALTNLLKNCMEHTPEGGSITIEAADRTLYTGILITDTGSGIAPEDLPHLFERFYRGGSSGGYGIGLAFAQKIITAQSGSLQARNVQPHGAQFDIRFYKGTV